MEPWRERSLSRETPDHEPVVVLHLAGDALPAEFSGTLHAGGGHLRTEIVVRDQASDRRSQRLGFPRRDQQRVAITPDDALVAMDVAAHDRGTRGHRLEQDDPERLAPGGRRHVYVGRLEQRIPLLLPNASEELHASHPAGHDVAPSLALLGPAAHDQEAALAAGLAQEPGG